MTTRTDRPDPTPAILARRAHDAALARKGDAASIAELVASVDKLVWKLARRYARNPEWLEDLVAEGRIGALEAAQKFDPEAGVVFMTYASWWVLSGVQRWVHEHSRLIRIPVRMQEKKGRAETLARFGEETERGASIRILMGARPASLDAPHSSEDGQDWTLGDSMEAGGLTAEEKMLRDEGDERIPTLRKAVSKLEPRHQAVILGRAAGKSLDEIGHLVGVGRERVRQIETKAIVALRRELHLLGLSVRGGKVSLAGMMDPEDSANLSHKALRMRESRRKTMRATNEQRRGVKKVHDGS